MTTRRRRSRLLTDGSLRLRLPATSPERPRRRTTLIRANLHRAPMYSGTDRQSRAALLPVDRGQGRALRRSRASTRSFSSRRGSTTDTSTPTGSRPPCREEVQHAMLPLIPGLERAAMRPAGLRDRVRLRRPARARSEPGDPARSRSVPRRADQRDHRLRGGGGARPRRPGSTRRSWPAARTARARPGRRLYRRADRRPRHPRRQRALSDVHLARRVSPRPAGRQCRRAADADRAAARLCRAGRSVCLPRPWPLQLRPAPP